MDTYLVGSHLAHCKRALSISPLNQLQTTTQAARVNLEAFSNPVPAVNLDQPTLIPDDVRWEIMTHSGTAETAVDPRGRIVSWARDVREGHLDDTQPDGVITTGEINISIIDGGH